MIQFFDTLQQITQCDSVWACHGISKHLNWQVRKIFNRFPCELAVAGSKLYVDRPLAVAALINAMGEYDYNNMSLLKFLLAHFGGTFIDVGANIGVYSLIASEFAGVKVLSIEPHPATFRMLVKNIELNDRHNVNCLNLAVSSEEGELDFTNNPGSPMNRVIGSQNTRDATLRVPSQRLDALCNEIRLIPDFVKIDVEGHEAAVLAGFTDLANIAKIFFIEGGEKHEVRSWMEDAGYTGPWFFHSKRQILSRSAQRRPEDPVYIHRDFFSTFQTISCVSMAS